LWVFARLVAVQKGLLLPDPLFDRLRSELTLERCLALGAVLILAGLGAALYALLYWYDLSFGQIQDERLIKVVCAASLLTVLGFQVIFSSFFLYLLDQSTEMAERADWPFQATKQVRAE
jgi:hypothetical protein